MATNSDDSVKLALINKQILEMKKKIQLSEGQRKALFEVCETERKSNLEEMKKLKKTINGLVTSLQENKSQAVKYRMNTIRLESIVGPVAERNVNDIIDTIDLQIIDKRKQLDLLRYKKKKKQIYLKTLAEEYRDTIAITLKKVSPDKLTEPLKRSVRDLQNNIHAVEVQLKEAGHVRVRYKSIRLTLLDDSGRFEGNIKTIEEELKSQRFDIDKLQEIATEASKMRNAARKMLLKEEKLSLSAASLRDRQAIEGKRLLQEAKQELEKLERRIFLGGKPSQTRQTDANVEEEQPTQIETPSPSPQPFAEYLIVFDNLRNVTGGNNVKEVLDRFYAQRATTTRLMHLRQANETDKNKLEKRLEILISELDKYKYTEMRDSEKNIEQIENVQKSIEMQNERKSNQEAALFETDEEFQKIFKQLHKFYVELNPCNGAEDDAQMILSKIRNEVLRMLEKIRTVQMTRDEFVEEEIEDKWLPPPYTGLIRRTPLPQAGSSPIPPQAVSEEEEEVPSRTYLKRQAQLVVDAKSRRKNIRMLPKLK